MANNWYQEQLTNRNFLSPIGFLFSLQKAPKVAFLCQRAEIPSIRVGFVDVETPGLASIPLEGNIEYGELNLEFIVDEDLRNYMEIHNWIRALGTPDNLEERGIWLDDFRPKQLPGEEFKFIDSDATLRVLNNNNNANFEVVFKGLFPVSLSTLSFDVTGTDNEFFTATATFKYMLYEVRDNNRMSRR